MIVITGAAGFIGSNIVASLNETGRSDLVVCDRLGSDGKWNNLRKAQFADYLFPEELLAWLNSNSNVEAVIHMGAISSTTATDGDQVIDQNFRFSLRLMDACTAAGVPFIYASSAAVYGEGHQGFSDDQSPAAIAELRPLNLYGWSKRQFDHVVATRAATGQAMPPQWVGLRFFNVFGPNEYAKGDMKSLIAKMFDPIRKGEQVSLFKSHREGIADGEQQRDFVYVKDVGAVVLWLLDNRHVSGIFNVGTGQARSFRALAEATFLAAGRTPDIRYVDMPDVLRDRYQYYTAATLDRLSRAGYRQPFWSLEEGIADYVTQYLAADDPYR